MHSRIHFPPVIFSLHWPWTLNYDLDLRTWPRHRQDKPSRQVFPLKVTSFISYRPDTHTHTHTHTQPTSCITRPRERFVKIYTKAPSTPATVSKQHCRMLQVERFFRQSRMLLRQSCLLLRHCCWCGRGLRRDARYSTEGARSTVRKHINQPHTHVATF